MIENVSNHKSTEWLDIKENKSCHAILYEKNSKSKNANGRNSILKCIVT